MIIDNKDVEKISFPMDEIGQDSDKSFLGNWDGGLEECDRLNDSFVTLGQNILLNEILV